MFTDSNKIGNLQALIHLQVNVYTVIRNIIINLCRVFCVCCSELNLSLDKINKIENVNTLINFKEIFDGISSRDKITMKYYVFIKTFLSKLFSVKPD